MNIWDKAHILHRAWRYRLRTERPEILFLLNHLGRGQTTLDIGAHKGVYSYWMHRCVGPTGRVIAFEPQSELADYIEQMKAAFGMKELTVVQAGLSSCAGTKELLLPFDHPHGRATLEKGSEEGDSIDVSVVRLDDYLDEARARPVHFLKCDVEGHELEVFRGAPRMLREDRPILLFECQEFRHPEGQTRLVFEYLRQFGYRGYYFDERGTRALDDFRVAIHQNRGGCYFDNFAFLPAA
jgi:FkbM family methyltransferase